MPLTSAQIERLVRAGATAKSLIVFAKIMEDVQGMSAAVSAPVSVDTSDEKRKKDRERKRLQRFAARAASVDTSVLSVDCPAEKSPTPSSLLTSSPSLSLFQEGFEEGKVEIAREREKLFSDIWPEYPRRKGNNPRKTARVRYLSALSAGVSAEVIADGVRRYRGHCEAEGNIGTPYIQRMDVWLNQEGWMNDYGTSETHHKPNSIAGRFEAINARFAEREREIAGVEGSDENSGDYIEHVP